MQYIEAKVQRTTGQQNNKRTREQGNKTTRQQSNRVESRMLPSTDCINKTAEKYKQYAKHVEDEMR